MPAGGYVCRIVKVAAVNRYDEQCLLIYLDVSEGEFQNYFGRIYARRLGHGDDNYPCVYNQSMSPFEKISTAYGVNHGEQRRLCQQLSGG